MELLEREPQLEVLYELLAQTRQGHGRVALVSGEAGIGKTSLVRRFTVGLPPSVRVFSGECDALFTPRPLGPVYDLVSQAAPALQAQIVAGSDWLSMAHALLSELQHRLTVVVFEDMHWADAATLDLLKFVCRRIRKTNTLLILTFRDDELGPQHPLRLVLGDLATTGALHRIPLHGLSVDGVRSLAAGKPLDLTLLHRQTNGNPFFVSEVIASEGHCIPATARDAVLSRAVRLSWRGRAALEAAAVIGLRVEPWLLAKVVHVEPTGAAECLDTGMLQTEGDRLAFRHELSRQVILDATSPARRLALRRLILAALAESSMAERHPDRLVHHAEAANDAAAAQRYAVAAARQAAAAHSYRKAAAHYARALRFSTGLPAAARGQLWEDYGQVCGVLGQHETALAAFRQAAQLWQQIGDALRQGNCLTQIAIFHVRIGQIAQASEANRQAIGLLEPHPPSCELAHAYSLQGGLHVQQCELAETLNWARKAEALAVRLGDTETLALTCSGMGIALLGAGDDAGLGYLEQSYAMATEGGHDLATAAAISDLAAVAVVTYQFDLADGYLAEGFVFCQDREQDYLHRRLLARQAVSLLYQGRWAEAEAAASTIFNRVNVGVDRLEALVVIARLHARRATYDAASPLLDEALALAGQTGLLPNLAMAHAARAEAAWLTGDWEGTLAEARAVFDLVEARRQPWLAGALAFWRWRAGDSFSLPEWTAAPFAAQIKGDWQKAAAEWEHRGCPYEQAQALADGDHAAQLAALAIFEELGAAAAAQRLRQTLRATGMRGVPRGPRPATRANPFGLTARQMEVLGLVAVGMSNSEIAARLCRSPSARLSTTQPPSWLPWKLPRATMPLCWAGGMDSSPPRSPEYLCSNSEWPLGQNRYRYPCAAEDFDLYLRSDCT